MQIELIPFENQQSLILTFEEINTKKRPKPLFKTYIPSPINSVHSASSYTKAKLST